MSSFNTTAIASFRSSSRYDYVHKSISGLPSRWQRRVVLVVQVAVGFQPTMVLKIWRRCM